MENIRSAFDAWKSNPARSALIRLLESSQILIFGVCFEVLRHRHDAEDATQRVLLEIQKGIGEVADADHFLRRLRLVAFRTALDTRRDRRRRVDRERKAADMNPPAPLPDEVREAIHEAMSALDEESRALVIEHYFERATLDAIAARRGVSAAAIWKRIEAIKGKLRHGLALAGLAAAASKAEACLESATLVAPSVNLVTVATIGGGAMAAKTSTAAAIVAAVTFALGLGGGLAIQAARIPEGPTGFPVAGSKPPPIADRIMVTNLTTRSPLPQSTNEPIGSPVESAEERFKLAREIWAQMSRPRFWKDQEAQNETLPKLVRLGPEHASFFIERFRDPGTNHEAKKSAVRLAVTSGGPDAAELLLEVMQAGPAQEAFDYRMNAFIVLKGEGGGGMPELPFSEALNISVIALLTSENGWDRSMALSVLAFGDPAHWKPIVKEAAKSDTRSLMRSETVKLLVARGDADILAFFRDERAAICSTAPDPRYGPSAAQEVERQRERLGRVLDQAITDLESKLKK